MHSYVCVTSSPSKLDQCFFCSVKPQYLGVKMLPEHPELTADAPTVAVRIQHVSAIKSVLKQRAVSSHGRDPGFVPGH